MSTFRIEVVPVKLEPHPNADSLSIVKVFGFTCCVRTESWVGVEKAAYVPPDSIVDTTRPEFSFLGDKTRVKAMRLRGVSSFGLLAPVPDHCQIGDDVTELLGVTHYDPPEIFSPGGEAERPPEGYHPSYDVESGRRWDRLFSPGELVHVTCKIHGSSGRFYWDKENSRFHCGSRNEWKKEESGAMWWRILNQTPELQGFLRNNPDITVYGEVYGQVQDLKYGQTGIKLAVFDLLRGSTWIDQEEARELGKNLPWVPEIARNFPFDAEKISTMAEGKSLIPGADHMREGVVVRPMKERTCNEIGRVITKYVGVDYLSRKERK